MMETYEGELTVDLTRGTVWFNTEDGAVLRICNLPVPIPAKDVRGSEMLDITHLIHTNWDKKSSSNPKMRLMRLLKCAKQ